MSIAKLGARLRVGGEPPAGGDRKIRFGRRPARIARTIKGERARDIADPSDPGRGLLLGKSRSGEKSECEKALSKKAHGSSFEPCISDNGSIAAPLWLRYPVYGK